MATKKTRKPTTPKKVTIDAPENSPMGKFHKAMQKIVTIPKNKLKDK